MENVREVMAEVGNWEEVGGLFGLDVPRSKQQEIKQQSSTEREKSLALGDYWVNTDPDASWEKLARVLYQQGEEKAAAVMKQYLPQGMCVLSCLLWKLWSSKDGDLVNQNENCSSRPENFGNCLSIDL